MKRSNHLNVLLAACIAGLALVLVACGGDGSNSPSSANPSVTSVGVPAPGGALTVEEALVADASGPLLVRGNLIATDSQIRLCSAIAESAPPQCGEPSLLVVNLDLSTIDGLVDQSGVSWTDGAVELIGVVTDGVLAVDQLAT